MVTIEYIASAALANAHRVVARAFLRALGIDAPREELGRWPIVPAEDAELAWCFRNHGSPMDGRA